MQQYQNIIDNNKISTLAQENNSKNDKNRHTMYIKNIGQNIIINNKIVSTAVAKQHQQQRNSINSGSKIVSPTTKRQEQYKKRRNNNGKTNRSDIKI